MVFRKIRKAFSENSNGSEAIDDEYLEIDLNQPEKKESKVHVRLFVLKTYDDVTPILNALREGYTIAVIDIHELRKKDAIELKRAVSKIKKTADALEGSIAGFGENSIIVTPSFATIDKGKSEEKSNASSSSENTNNKAANSYYSSGKSSEGSSNSSEDVTSSGIDYY